MATPKTARLKALGSGPRTAPAKDLETFANPNPGRDYLIRMLDVHQLRHTGGVGQHLMRAWPTST